MGTERAAGDRGHRRCLILTLALLGLFLVAPGMASAAGFFGVVPQRELLTEDFERLGSADATLRLGVHWPNLQPTKGESDEIRHNLDDEFGEAAANGVQILPFVNNSPPWISSDEDIPPIHSLADREAFKNFMRLLVARYGPGGEYWTGDFLSDFPGATPRPVEIWQIWNEPSSPASWEPKPSAKDYGTLVKLADSAIQEVDPAAKVMLAGLFYSPSNNGPLAPKFINELLGVNGVKKAFDYAAVHAYGANVNDVSFQIEAVRKALDKRGAAAKKLYVTETGWATCPSRVHPVCTSESGQAKKLQQVFKLAKNQKRNWNLGGMYWYSLVDAATSEPTRCSFCAKTGLFRANRTPKPAWSVFTSFAAR